MVAVNAATEMVDAVGLLPQWAGGTGVAWNPLPKGTTVPWLDWDISSGKDTWGEQMDMLGWDQKGFDRDTTQNSYLSAANQTIWNPLKGVYGIGAGALEGGGYLAGKGRDLLTWSSPESRQVAEQKRLTQDMQGQKKEELAAQKDQLRQVLSGRSGGTLSPEQRYKLQREYEELDARTGDAAASADAMEDETADWELGKQHTFGSGGHYYRDAMTGSKNRLTAKIKQLETQELDPKGQLDLKNMIARRDEIGRSEEQYSKEVGYFGEGDFAKITRQRVLGGKQRMVELRSRMREPAVKLNPELMMQLEADYRHQQRQLANMRSWADQAAKQKLQEQ
jgi:hypothetical protein